MIVLQHIVLVMYDRWNRTLNITNDIKQELTTVRTKHCLLTKCSRNCIQSLNKVINTMTHYTEGRDLIF